MNVWQIIKRPPWRTVIPGVLLIVSAVAGYSLWSPGADIRDGRHDRGQNGIWLAHGWLGADDWFVREGKTNQFAMYRDPARIRDLAALLRLQHITDVFPHLCPAELDGRLPAVNAEQVERFLDQFSGFRVLPWIGGPRGAQVRLHDSKWRSSFSRSVTALLLAHPRLAGVQLNVEPLPSGDANFLAMLDELRAALPKGKLISIAAYPPPTRWHTYEDVHWNETYFREVAKRSDQMAVMMYDTALRVPKLYEQLMADWTEEVLLWSDAKPVLLGVPAYDDVGAEYHHTEVENLAHGLSGIHRGLLRRPLAANYQGVAIYCEWETDTNEWRYWREHFLKP